MVIVSRRPAFSGVQFDFWRLLKVLTNQTTLLNVRIGLAETQKLQTGNGVAAIDLCLKRDA